MGGGGALESSRVHGFANERAEQHCTTRERRGGRG